MPEDNIHKNKEINSPISRKSEVKELDMAEFETALNNLERLVERMEKGNQSLEESINDFEKGMKLTKQCQISIEKAEQRVNQLIAKHGDYSPEPFHIDDEKSEL